MTPEMSTAAAEKRARLRKRAVDEVASDTPQRGSRASRPRKAPPEAAGEEMAERVHRFDDRVGEFDGDVGLEEDGVGERSGGVRLWSKGWRGVSKENKEDSGNETECYFVGDPIDVKEAEEKWPHRYEKKAAGSWDASTTGKSLTEEDIKACRHYLQAKVDGIVYDLNDCAYVKAGEGEDSFICRIVEFFEGANRQLYFTAQWFYRAKDTVIKENAGSHDPRRVFQSEDRNDNPLECLVSKIKIVLVKPNIDLEKKANGIPECDLYYDMSYSTKYSSFTNIPYDKVVHGSPISSLTSESESSDDADIGLSLLDLYSGCGAMSTGLCLGANFGGTQLETRWAVDMSIFACESLKLNHPRAEVRNEDAENFLALLLEWEKLCRRFSLIGTESCFVNELYSDNLDGDGEAGAASDVPPGEFEVGKLVGICYGDPSKIGKVGLKFKVRWKGYGPSEDTWEAIDGLSKCQERIKDFVQSGYKRNILPLPGKVDVICGGPPCQGISGFNRFRRFDAPLKDPKNKQIVVFMDIVEFLKPRYVLMENVVDILKFARGFLGRYALSRLVAMNYQTRMGLMVAGCYGLPQFRMRVFLWGAVPTEKLPQFPFPTHDVVVRGGAPQEFEANLVAYDETQRPKLEKALLLADAISDLPPVTNAEARDEMPHGQSPKTNFQHYIRLSRDEMSKIQAVDRKPLSKGKLFDHRPLELNEDDYQRVCQIPREKGANFRHLAGVKVGEGNVVEWDPTVPRVYLPSGKPLVPDYAMSFIKGKSTKPFGRLWWDETVPTVVTRAEPHNQVILHPEQDRVLSVRENARLQGFPDYYQLRGPIKERYIQVGNAVAVPVARALGVALANALKKLGTEDALFELPSGFTTQRH